MPKRMTDPDLYELMHALPARITTDGDTAHLSVSPRDSGAWVVRYAFASGTADIVEVDDSIYTALISMVTRMRRRSMLDQPASGGRHENQTIDQYDQ